MDTRTTKQPNTGLLEINGIRNEDAGEYMCTATRGQEVLQQSARIKVAGIKLPVGCMDKPWLANCDLIIEAEMCQHRYFSNFCCLSCYQSGQLPQLQKLKID